MLGSLWASGKCSLWSVYCFSDWWPPAALIIKSELLRTSTKPCWPPQPASYHGSHATFIFFLQILCAFTLPELALPGTSSPLVPGQLLPTLWASVYPWFSLSLCYQRHLLFYCHQPQNPIHSRFIPPFACSEIVPKCRHHLQTDLPSIPHPKVLMLSFENSTFINKKTSIPHSQGSQSFTYLTRWEA